MSLDQPTRLPAGHYVRNLLSALGVLTALGVASLAVAGPGATAPTDDSPHLVVVPDSAKARVALAGSSARRVAGYEAYTLVEAARGDVGRLVAAGGQVRDDMREVRIGTRSSDPATDRPHLLDKTGGSIRRAAGGGTGLAVVQYVGPLKDAWIHSVRKTGVEVVSYMAQNGQLVSGDGGALAKLADLSTKQGFIRAVTPYTPQDKQLPGLDRTGKSEVVITTVAGDAGASARAAVDRNSSALGSRVPVARLVQQRVALDGGRLDALAALGGVVSIEPIHKPKLLDERASQIVAGNLNTAFQPLLGAGYRSYLVNKGFSTNSGVTVDITDEGVDKGVVPPPAGSHPDFYRLGATTQPSRIRYAHEATAADADARDCGGHGTSAASIAAGYNAQAGANFEDAQGFNYGLGVSPYGRLGATKIFNCAGTFDVQSSITALHDQAYASGARISNNSWGSATGGAYNAQAQEFDALVRDAQPGVAGRQQLTEVASAGNSGAGANTIGSPGSAKNVISVGASENVRSIGSTDGCGVADTAANSARDIADFSSRGPTDDGRTKPDVVAPGTHIAGAQPQTGADFNGSGTCNPQFPAGSSLYTLVSGSSVAAPQASGFASLLHEWYLKGLGGGTNYPSPAMTKALMVNTATDLAGGDAGNGGLNANVPDQDQGWGRVNLGKVLDGTSRQVVDQTQTFSTTGSYTSRYYNVASSSRPLRVTLAWTDPPGPTTGNSFVNDLDLEVTAGGTTYKGNMLSGGRSVPGGVADPRNNVENVFLPPGVSGAVKVRVIAKNLAGDGVPGAGDATDQDYALLVSDVGAPQASKAVLTDAGTTLTRGGDGDAYLEPNEPFTLATKLRNVGNATATSITGTLSAPSSDATVTQPSSSWPNLATSAAATGSPAFGAKVAPALTCGDTLDATVHVSSSGGPIDLPVSLQTGHPSANLITAASTDVPKAIPDGDPAGVSSSVTVPSAGSVADVDVAIGGLAHTFDSDLEIDLTSPAGTTVRLFNRNGGSGDNLTNTVFDDAAATPISSGTAPFTGSFRPFQSLSAFKGERAQGTWRLTVRDLANEDTGTLDSWSLKRRPYVC